MGAASRDLFAEANLGRDIPVVKNDRCVAKNDQGVAFDEKVRKLCVSLWGRDSVAQISINGDITVRQAQRIMARESGFSLDVFRSLMRGPYGGRFFDLAMEGATSEWARDTQQERKISNIRKQRRDLEKQLKELEAE